MRTKEERSERENVECTELNKSVKKEAQTRKKRTDHVETIPFTK